jgi:hypothetical protein
MIVGQDQPRCVQPQRVGDDRAQRQRNRSFVAEPRFAEPEYLAISIEVEHRQPLTHRAFEGRREQVGSVACGPDPQRG